MPHLNSSLFLIPSLFPGIILSCLTGSSSPGLSNKVKSTNNGSFGQLAGFLFSFLKKKSSASAGGQCGCHFVSSSVTRRKMSQKDVDSVSRIRERMLLQWRLDSKLMRSTLLRNQQRNDNAIPIIVYMVLYIL